MSKDIRSFFTPINQKSSKPSSSKNEEPTQAKRRAIVLSSDEDDAEKVKGTPQEKVPTRKEKSSKFLKKRRVIESDSEDDNANVIKSPVRDKKPNLSKLKEDFMPKYKKPTEEEIQEKFGHVPVRVERKKIPSNKQSTKNIDESSVVSFSDDEFNNSIMQIDENKLVSTNNTETQNDSKVVEEMSKKTPKKQSPIKTDPISHKSPKKNVEIAKTPIKKKIKDKTETEKSESVPKKETESEKHGKSPGGTGSKVKKTLSEITYGDAPSKTTPKSAKASKKTDLNSSVLSDEERHERKRAAAILFQKFKHRQGPANPGSKEIPQGKPNCLAGLTFIVTGVLESMERDEANQVIKDLGGKISTTVGKRLNYMVVGEEAGPKKIATAEELGITMLTEDQLFDLIREKSGEEIKSVKKEKKDSPNKKENNESKPKIKDEHKTPVKKEKRDTSEENEVKKEKHKSKSAEKRKHDKDDEKNAKIKKEKVESPEKPKKVPKEEKHIKTESEENNKNIDQSMLAWVDKYKPTNLKQIIGQQGAASIVVKLRNWLSKWYSNHDGKKKLQKPNPWAKNDDGSFYKAALLSGPPGVGKTTTAHLVCKELGFDVVEFNASDTRSKKLLKEEVSELLTNKSLFGYFCGKKETVSKQHVLIMDEVDGMAGNEDRGGVSELIALIKDTSIPIICMCNDRNHPKMRSLVNYCYDLRFNKPRLEQIRGPIMSICFKEKFKLPPGKIDEIISATNNDIRQTLNHLSLLAAGDEINLEVKDNDKTAKKDLKLGPWDVVRKVFTAEDQRNMTIHEKSDLFFNDYSLGPLFVQHNYLQVLPDGPRDKIPEKVALTADALSLGDLIDKRIRSNSAWSLLPVQAMFSSVMPGEYMSGHFVSVINFPGWLGKYSKTNKRKRLAQELHDHTRIRTSGSRLSITQDYAPFLLDAIVRPLKEKGIDGVEDALNVMKEYRLLREDLDSLIELTTWPGKKNPMESVDGKVKAALTRAYNKEVLPYSYSATAAIKKKKSEKMDDITELEGEEEGGAAVVSDDDEEDDKLENDALIKAKKKPAAKASTSKETKADSKKAASKAPKKSKK